METILWVWNGCYPEFPWWCGGFLYMGIFFGVFIVTLFLLASVDTYKKMRL